MEIRTRRIMVTGGCGGIGRAVVEVFLAAGARVDIVDMNVGSVRDLAARMPDRVTLHECDFADLDAVARRLAPVFEGEDAPDGLFNGAGSTPKYGPDGQRWTTPSMPLDHWRRILTINLHSAFLLTQMALRTMTRRRAGRIVNVASLAARTSGNGVAPVHYVASKAGMIGLTKVAAKEAGPFGVTVNAINPGRIDTPMIRDVPDEVNQGYLRRIPLGRLGLPEDIAKTALYLCSDMADYVTGTTIEVNGGVYVGP